MRHRSKIPSNGSNPGKPPADLIIKLCCDVQKMIAGSEYDFDIVINPEGVEVTSVFEGCFIPAPSAAAELDLLTGTLGAIMRNESVLSQDT